MVFSFFIQHSHTCFCTGCMWNKPFTTWLLLENRSRKMKERNMSAHVTLLRWRAQGGRAREGWCFGSVFWFLSGCLWLWNICRSRSDNIWPSQGRSLLCGPKEEESAFFLGCISIIADWLAVRDGLQDISEASSGTDVQLPYVCTLTFTLKPDASHTNNHTHTLFLLLFLFNVGKRQFRRLRINTLRVRKEMGVRANDGWRWWGVRENAHSCQTTCPPDRAFLFPSLLPRSPPSASSPLPEAISLDQIWLVTRAQ